MRNERRVPRELSTALVAIAEAVCDRSHVMVARALLRCSRVQRQPKPARAHCPGDSDIQSEVPHLCPIAWLANGS